MRSRSGESLNLTNLDDDDQLDNQINSDLAALGELTPNSLEPTTCTGKKRHLEKQIKKQTPQPINQFIKNLVEGLKTCIKMLQGPQFLTSSERTNDSTSLTTTVGIQLGLYENSLTRLAEAHRGLAASHRREAERAMLVLQTLRNNQPNLMLNGLTPNATNATDEWEQLPNLTPYETTTFQPEDLMRDPFAFRF